MPRQPSVAAPAFSSPAPSEQMTLRIHVITPFFGGGFATREIDTTNPIRAAAIRGNLRFWWRATAGAQFADAEKLFEQEAALWGSTNTTGKVSVRVLSTHPGEQVSIADYRSGNPAQVGPRAQYFLFPFQAQKREGIAEAFGRKGVTFTLQLDVPAAKALEVRRAIRAWIAFGGVGARTRRGCGALKVVDNPAEWHPPAERAQRQAWFYALGGEAAITEAPFTLLANACLVIGASCDAIAAWQRLGEFWARFRKGHVGKKASPPENVTYSPMSGSRWQDYRRSLANYQQFGTKSIALAKPFLGLPIVYQKFNTAPYSPYIEAAATGRMASPVILKPLVFADGSCAPLVAVLSAPTPRKIRIDKQEVALKEPDYDPVLAGLGVTSPFEAVVKAAEQLWNQSQIRLGGMP